MNKRDFIMTVGSIPAAFIVSCAMRTTLPTTSHPKSTSGSGWRDLIASDLSNCTLKPGSWVWENGVLAWKGGGYIFTKEQYGDFILDLEFKVDKGANSGVFIRTADLKDIVQSSIEIQVHDTTDGGLHGQCGAVYDCLSPRVTATKPAGEWNRYTITCKANRIYVVLNGVQIIDMDLDQWTTPRKNPDGTPNKFNKAMKDMPRSGVIGLQDHGNPVWYRNLRIKAI